MNTKVKPVVGVKLRAL